MISRLDTLVIQSANEAGVDSNAIRRVLRAESLEISAAEYSVMLSDDYIVGLLHVPRAFDSLRYEGPESIVVGEQLIRFCATWLQRMNKEGIVNAFIERLYVTVDRLFVACAALAIENGATDIGSNEIPPNCLEWMLETMLTVSNSRAQMSAIFEQTVSYLFNGKVSPARNAGVIIEIIRLRTQVLDLKFARNAIVRGKIFDKSLIEEIWRRSGNDLAERYRCVTIGSAVQQLLNA